MTKLKIFRPENGGKPIETSEDPRTLKPEPLADAVLIIHIGQQWELRGIEGN